MSDIRTVEFSIVVVAENHNPSLLNRDFLWNNDIVPEEWNWEVLDEKSFSTVQASRVSYDSNVSIAVHQNKVIVKDVTFGLDPLDSKVPYIAKKFVDVLPHVNYQGVGINFHSGLQHETPVDFLKKKFLSEVSPDYNNQEMIQAGFKFTYELDDGQVNFEIDPGYVTSENDEGERERHKGVIVESNYHREFDVESSSIDNIKSVIDRVEADVKDFEEFFKTHFPDEINEQANENQDA